MFLLLLSLLIYYYFVIAYILYAQANLDTRRNLEAGVGEGLTQGKQQCVRRALTNRLPYPTL